MACNSVRRSCYPRTLLSALEATTISYVACALFSYAAWWKKLYDLQSPMIVSIAANHPLADWVKGMPLYISFDEEPKMTFDNRTYVLYVLGIFSMFASYSRLHLLAWEVHFGSTLEQQLWRWLTISLLAIHIPLCTAALLTQTRAGSVTVKKACIATWQWLAESLPKSITPRVARPFFKKIPRAGWPGEGGATCMASEISDSDSHAAVRLHEGVLDGGVVHGIEKNAVPSLRHGQLDQVLATHSLKRHGFISRWGEI